jgi:type IV secretion system protein VirB5
MKGKNLAFTVLLLWGSFGFIRSANAQFAVIDVGAIAQLVQQVQQLEQALQVAQSQLAQAQQAYVAITGGRGMERLLANIDRNYLPATWAQLLTAANGGGGRYAFLGGDVTATILRNAILQPANMVNYSPAETNILQARRSSVALNESLTRQELQSVSDRFDSIQRLTNAIPTATDEKAILDLQARIQVEEGMLENENSKLHVLYQAAQSQAQTAQARADEQAIRDIGHLADLPPMGL